VDPMLGRVVIERQRHVEVVSDLRGRLGPFRAEFTVERLRGSSGVGLVLGVVDLRQRPLRGRVGRLGQRGEDVADLVPPSPLLRRLGEHVPDGFQKPSAPSPTASTGAVMPRRLQSRSRSAHDSDDSQNPSARATSSLRPSARTPMITSRHTLSASSRTLRWMPSTQM
jgi:hypothetical protein